MSEQENICEICNGVLRIEYVFGFEQGRPHDMRLDAPLVASKPFRLCYGHPEMEEKHDGCLDEKNECRVLCGEVRVWVNGQCERVQGVHVDGIDDGINLVPAQALSLLVWLQQEKAHLEQLAKEQG